MFWKHIRKCIKTITLSLLIFSFVCTILSQGAVYASDDNLKLISYHYNFETLGGVNVGSYFMRLGTLPSTTIEYIVCSGILYGHYEPYVIVTALYSNLTVASTAYSTLEGILNVTDCATHITEPVNEYLISGTKINSVTHVLEGFIISSIVDNGLSPGMTSYRIYSTSSDVVVNSLICSDNVIVVAGSIGGSDAFIYGFLESITKYSYIINGPGRDYGVKLVLSDNTIYVCGVYSGDVFVGKMSVDGVIDWLLSYDLGGVDVTSDMIVYDGRIYITGITTQNNTEEGFLLILDEVQGDVVKCYKITGLNSPNFTSLVLLPPDTLIVIGYMSDNNVYVGLLLTFKVTDSSLNVISGFKIGYSTYNLELLRAFVYNGYCIVVGARYGDTKVSYEGVVFNVTSSNIINSIILESVSVEEVNYTLSSLSVTKENIGYSQFTGLSHSYPLSYTYKALSVRSVVGVSIQQNVGLPLSYEGIIGGKITGTGSTNGLTLTMEYTLDVASSIDLQFNIQGLGEYEVRIYNNTGSTSKLIYEGVSSSGVLDDSLGSYKPFVGSLLVLSNNANSSYGGLGGILVNHVIVYPVLLLVLSLASVVALMVKFKVKS